MRENFVPTLNTTLVFEGGYSNHPRDPGRHTYKGVTLATLRRYKPGATVADLKAISDDLLQRIYRDGYWNEVNGDRLAAGVDLATFDYAVNSGPQTALKQLMKVVGGPAHDTVKKLCGRRLASYKTFKHWRDFGKGWTRRIAAIEAKGVAWALAAKHDTATVQQGLDDEAAAAKKKAAAQSKGAGGAAAGTGGGAATTADPALADQIAGWVLAGFVVAGVALVVWLVIRARINNARRRAYEAEAAAL